MRPQLCLEQSGTGHPGMQRRIPAEQNPHRFTLIRVLYINNCLGFVIVWFVNICSSRNLCHVRLGNLWTRVFFVWGEAV